MYKKKRTKNIVLLYSRITYMISSLQSIVLSCRMLFKSFLSLVLREIPTYISIFKSLIDLNNKKFKLKFSYMILYIYFFYLQVHFQVWAEDPDLINLIIIIKSSLSNNHYTFVGINLIYHQSILSLYQIQIYRISFSPTLL